MELSVTVHEEKVKARKGQQEKGRGRVLFHMVFKVKVKGKGSQRYFQKFELSP